MTADRVHQNDCKYNEKPDTPNGVMDSYKKQINQGKSINIRKCDLTVDLSQQSQ